MRPDLRLDDPRLRIVATGVTAFAFSTLGKPVPLALMAGLTCVLVVGSGIGIGELTRRLRVPGLMLGALIMTLPFTSGTTVVASLGPLSLRAEGLAAALTIALRFLCIMSVAAALIATLGPARLIAGLRGLRVPALITDMAMLTLRHIDELRHELARMRLSMWLRGAPAGFRRGQFRAGGWALASLLLRAHARSDRIYQAMLLRGHGAKTAPLPQFVAPAPAEKRALIALMIALGALIGLEMTCR